MDKNPHAQILGKLGGSKTSERKKLAAQRNAKKPRKRKKAVDKQIAQEVIGGRV